MRSPWPCPSARPPPRPTSAGPWSSSAPATAPSWSRWPTSTAWSTRPTRRHRTLHNHATPWRWAYRAAKVTGLAYLPFDAWGAQDRHRARLGDGQGPPLHVLAQARRRPSVHPPDLRLALPGVPRSRAAVLQPRRPAISGARHRAAGSGAGPAVAGQGDDQGRHRPRPSRPRRCRLAGVAAGCGWAGAPPSPLPHGDGAVLPGPAGPSTRP